MTEAEPQNHEEISLLALGAILLRNRWRIVRWTLIGAGVAFLLAIGRPALYSASASFVPRGSSNGAPSGLASLAGQFGVVLPSGDLSVSPDFYARLLKSRELLRQIVLDTFVVREAGDQRISFLELFRIVSGSAERREEQGVKLLAGIVSTSVVKTTGVVELSVATRWPSVSLAIVTSLVDEVNMFNQRTRQGQAAAERQFVEGRMTAAGADLRAAEDRMEQFLKANRQFSGSPELTFQEERLQRAVMQQQQLFTALSQSYEEARIREVRDTPVITVIETPWVPAVPQPRGRLKLLLLGITLGASIGALLAATSGTIIRRRAEGDADLEALLGTLGEMRGEILGPVRRLTQRFRR